MGNETTGLSPVEAEKALAWLKEHGANGPCPICRNTTWTLADMKVITPQFMNGGISLGPGVPAVVVFCRQCGFLRFHSAVMMGLAVPLDAEVKNG